jgi:hypothetical protein
MPPILALPPRETRRTGTNGRRSCIHSEGQGSESRRVHQIFEQALRLVDPARDVNVPKLIGSNAHRNQSIRSTSYVPYIWTDPSPDR